MSQVADSQEPSPLPSFQATAFRVGWITGLYALLGLIGLQLAIPPSTASPLFPAAGFALAAVLWYGRVAVVGVFAGQFLMQMARCWLGGNGWPLIEFELALAFACGAALQAFLAAFLVTWWKKDSWRELAFERYLYGFLVVGGAIACVVSATVGMTALGLAGFVPGDDLLYEGWKWYVGDTLGVFVFTPLTLVFLGADAGIWRSGNRGVILKMAVMFGLVMVAFSGAARWEQAARIRQLDNDGKLAASRLADRVRLLAERLKINRDLIGATGQPNQALPELAVSIFEQAAEIRLLAWQPEVEQGSNQPNLPVLANQPGWSLAAEPSMAFGTLIATAQQTGQPAATAVWLVRQQKNTAGDPTHDNVEGLLVAVAADASGQSGRQPEGGLVAGIEQQQLLQNAVGKLPAGLTMSVQTQRREAGGSAPPAKQVGQDLHWVGSLPVSWLDWQIEAETNSAYLKGDFDVTWIVAILSLLFTALFADRDIAFFAAVSREEAALEGKRRLEQELSIAHDIQQGLLPKQPPILSGFDLAGWNGMAEKAGGDLYDFVPLADGRLAIAIADVTGHGLGPALVAAEVRALFRATVARGEQLGEVVAAMHRVLAEDLPDQRLVTACFLLVSPEKNRVEYFSAGQGPLLLCRGGTGTVEQLPVQGLPFGFLDEPSTELAGQVELGRGDSLVLITDGFFEAVNPAGQPLGVPAVEAIVASHRHGTAAEMVTHLQHGVANFVAGMPQQDDLTAVVVKRR